MLKIVMEIDSSLPKNKVDYYCEIMDNIFEENNVPCVSKSFGKRIYQNDNEEINLAEGGMALIEISDNEELRKAIVKGIWQTDTETDDIVKEFFRD